MKKLLLTLAAAVLGMSAYAQDVTESFAKDDAAWYTTLKADAANQTTLTSTNTGITYNSEQAYNASGYLMVMGKSVTPKGSLKFKLDFACSNITIYSRSGASASQAVTVSAGTTAIITNEKISATDGGNLSIDIPAASQAAGTEYTIQASANYNVQITKIVYTQAGGAAKEDAALSFSESEVSVYEGITEFTAPVLSKATDATINYSSSSTKVATVDEEGVVTIVGAGTTVIAASADANDKYTAGSASYTLNVYEGMYVEKATTIASGNKYAICAGTEAAKNLTSNYGYLYTLPTLDIDGKTVISTTCAFTFTTDGEGYNIQDEAGYYYYMTGAYTSFNRAIEKPEEGAVWNVTINDDGTATIENASTKKTLAYFAEKVSFGAYETIEEGYTLPTLYGDINNPTGITTVEADENAPVEYYNLQGVRAANPESGLYIRRQGSKAVKVLVK